MLSSCAAEIPAANGTGAVRAVSRLYGELQPVVIHGTSVRRRRCLPIKGNVPQQHPGRRTFEPPRLVQVLHDDDRWYRASQFEWVRWPTSEWRAGISYSTGPGASYIRSVRADRLIAELTPDRADLR